MDKLTLSNPPSVQTTKKNDTSDSVDITKFDFDAVPQKRFPRHATWSSPVIPMWLQEKHLQASRLPQPLYDNDGLPILSDGSNRLLSLEEMRAMEPKMQVNLPKRRKWVPPKRKNPPPRKVDIDAMFREEAERQKRLEEYK